MHFADGSSQIAVFRDGLLAGMGSVNFPDGSAYRGFFSCGLPNGPGILHRANGQEIDGQWRNGELISSSRDENSVMP